MRIRSRLASLGKRLFFLFLQKALLRRDATKAAGKWFPTCHGRNYFFSPLRFKDAPQIFFTKFYLEKSKNPLTIDFKDYKAEVLPGRFCARGTPWIERVTEPSALPFAVSGVEITQAQEPHLVKGKIGGVDYDFDGLAPERYYYLPIRSPGDVEFKSTNDLIVGKPIPFADPRRRKYRLVLAVFIDTLSKPTVDYLSALGKIPNITRLLNGGISFENCHTTSNWTLPCVGSIFTGKTLSEHGMFHNLSSQVFLDRSTPVLPDYFQRAGYLTFQACGNHRKSPGYGYTQGFDRTIYRIEMPMEETFSALDDHLRAFPERDHFAWISIMDAHHVLSDVPELTTMLSLPLSAQDYRRQNAKSPLRLKRDERATSRYYEEIIKIDRKLGGLLYNIDSLYTPEERLICLLSDHGPSFTTDDAHVLSDEKTHTVLSFCGGGIPAGVKADELVQVTDVLPSLLGLAGLGESEGAIHGRMPQVLGGSTQRQWVVSENRYVGQKYLVTIKDMDHSFHLTFDDTVKTDGSVALDRFTMELFRSDNFQQDILATSPELAERFRKIAFAFIEDARGRKFA